MVVLDRYFAVQNEYVRLYHVFQRDGMLLSLPSEPTVEILDKDGITVLETLTAHREGPGTYCTDYFVPITATTGRYYDKWTFIFETGGTTQEVATYFEVHPKDAILNFSSSLISEKYTDAMNSAILDLSVQFIEPLLKIPIYSEQAQRTNDKARYNFAYRNWNKDPIPVIRINSRIVNEGMYFDYNGNVFFNTPLTDSDVVIGNYNFSFFNKEDLASFVDSGLAAMNAVPPSSASYSSVASAPAEWWNPILIYAAIQAYRRVLIGLTLQEISIVFGDDNRSTSARDVFRGMYEHLRDEWKEKSLGVKQKLPMMGQIITPEYTMPGGRARWYRYMYVSMVT